jgi:hypothetical protein
MNILLWYLPYAMFSGACDLALSEGETPAGRERTAETPERMRESDDATPSQLSAF